jgi:arginyl-tRNA synthetase
MKQELEQAIAGVCKKLFGSNDPVVLDRTEEQFGDYATNVALRLSKQLQQNPREVAQEIAKNLQSLDTSIAKVEVAGPGFINLTLTDEALWGLSGQPPAQTLAGKTIVAEYSDPNPFKILHAGHIYTTVVGDAIANLLQLAGAQVHRVNYGGDVGLHVGKTMWAILKKLSGEMPDKLDEIKEAERPAWLSARYIEGNTAYEDEEAAKTEIMALNKRVYQLQSDQDHDSAFARIYWTARQWSYEAFDAFYARIGTKLEKYYPESEVAEIGLQKVREHTGKVFSESDGAVVFKGEEYGLHTRVFITSQGLPTYEAKEVGLIIKKKEDYNFDRSVVITANEQQEYMAVALKAIEQFLPDLAKATQYIPHGLVKLSGGVKMSSRRGNIVPANEVLDVTAAANQKIHGKDDEQAVLGAIKYAFLKQRIGGDVIYNPEESVSLEGNSGPYLQYAHARARSILAKAQNEKRGMKNEELQEGERGLLRKISEYAEVVDRGVAEFMPHHICTYLYELAQVFNSFYEHNRVIGDDREATRLQLVQKYADTLKNGLTILSISAPERM